MTTLLPQLIRRVGAREYLVALAARGRLGFFAAAGLALLAIGAARLGNLFPAGDLLRGWWVLAILPVAAALATARRPLPQQLARKIDQSAGGRDLLLTALLTSPETGGFQAIVAERAEEFAREVVPAKVVPFRWQRGARDVVLAALAVAAAWAWLPQLDPLKKQAAREQAAASEQRLIETKKATELRRETLTQAKEEESREVKDALTRLEDAFKKAKPAEKENTLKELGEQQKDLGELWRKVNNNELRANLEQAAQGIGQADPKKLEEWRKELQKGDATALKKELAEMREQARKLAGAPDSADRRAAQQQLAQRLNELAQAMKQMAGSPQVNEALQRALEQMDLSKMGALSKEATQAAMDSLKLSEEEIDQLAQALKDGKQLEDALKNLQMARQLAGEGKLDGEQNKDVQGMDAYARLFSEKMETMGDSAGMSREAQMGKGRGNGALRPEDESAKTGFKPEKSSGQLAGGKMLLEWKTSEVGESGARTEEYRAAVRSVQQGVAEAIQQEQVPPGYHDSIKRYFDSLPQK